MKSKIYWCVIFAIIAVLTLHPLRLFAQNYTENPQEIIQNNEAGQGSFSEQDSIEAAQNEYLKKIEEDTKKRKERKAKIDEFDQCMTFILGCDSSYARFTKMAKLYSMTPKTASQLAMLQAEEQMKAAEMQQKYQTATADAEAEPTLQDKMKNLKQKYIALQVQSKEVQDAKFVPFIQRIKDYVLNFAGVAIIIMFLSMVKSKIAAIKAKRDSLKKYNELLNQQNNEEPTI